MKFNKVKFNETLSRIISIVAVPVLMTMAGGVQAEEQWKKSTGELSAMLVITDNPKAYSKTWKKAKEKLPDGMTASKIKKGKLVVALLFFKGCAVDTKKNCDSEVAFKVYTPKGKVYAKRDGLALWKAKPEKKNLMLSAANLAMIFDPKDIPGKYKIEVKIKDNISKRKLTLVRSVTLEK